MAIFFGTLCIILAIGCGILFYVCVRLASIVAYFEDNTESFYNEIQKNEAEFFNITRGNAFRDDDNINNVMNAMKSFRFKIADFVWKKGTNEGKRNE